MATSKITVLNFGFPFPQHQLEELSALVGTTVTETMVRAYKPAFFKPESSTPAAYIQKIVQSVDIPSDGRLIVNLPGITWAAIGVLSAIAGVRGFMPDVMRLNRDEEGVFHVQEVINLQALRDASRKTRYEGVDGVNLIPEGEKVLVNFSHPITDDQKAAIQVAEGPVHVVNVKTQADPNGDFAAQAAQFVTDAGLASELWQQPNRILVNAPAMAPLAAAVYAELNARMGEFPRTIQLNSTPERTYVFGSIVDVQGQRSWGQEQRIEIDRAAITEAQVELAKRLLQAIGKGKVAIGDMTGSQAALLYQAAQGFPYETFIELVKLGIVKIDAAAAEKLIAQIG